MMFEENNKITDDDTDDVGLKRLASGVKATPETPWPHRVEIRYYVQFWGTALGRCGIRLTVRPNPSSMGFVDIDQPTYPDFFMEEDDDDLTFLVENQMVAEGIIKRYSIGCCDYQPVLTEKGLKTVRIDRDFYEEYLEFGCW